MVGCSQGGEGGVAWRAAEESILSDCHDEPYLQDWTVPEALSVGPYLARVIEAEIIPRLLIAHSAPLVSALPTGFDDHIEGFTALVLEGRVDAVVAEIERMRADGASVETVFLDLLAPAAWRLGDLWKSDQCDFVEVTLGLGILQRLMSGLAADFADEKRTAAIGRRILLIPTPGEQHTFGLSMVEKFFRRAGWDVSGGPEFGEDLARLLRREPFDVIGLSICGSAQLGSLVATIRVIRRFARNKAVRILVGGAVFVAQPELAVLVGADATAADGPSAVVVAQSLLQMSARAG